MSYVILTTQALLLLRAAITEAAALLPAEVTKQYWIASQHVADPWTHVKFWYGTQSEYDPAVGNTIVHLEALSRAQEHLHGIKSDQQRNTAPNLSLPKVRRTA